MRTPAALTIVGLLIAGTPAQADLALLPPDSSPATKTAAPSPPRRRPAALTSVPHHVRLRAPISMIRPLRQHAGSAPTSPYPSPCVKLFPRPSRSPMGAAPIRPL